MIDAQSTLTQFSKSLRTIGAHLGQRVPIERKVCGFRCDHRDVQQGDLFFALVGKNADGHDFLRDVAARGGIAAVVSLHYRGPDFGLTLFRVADVLVTLQQLGHMAFIASGARAVAITGSLGKTTTKEFLAALLEGALCVHRSPGNANSQVGVPLTLLNAREGTELFVLEMGMSQPWEMRTLVAIAPPVIALLTHIALAHAAPFPDGLVGIAREKAEIFSSPRTELGIAHESTLRFHAVARERPFSLQTYGTQFGCDYRLVSGEDANEWYIEERGVPSLPLGRPSIPPFFMQNLGGAVAVARALGLSWEEIASRLPHLRTLPKRFERVIREGITFINDAYNANSVSVRAALTHLPPPERGGKTMAVLAAMPELGPFSEACHLEVAEVAFYTVDYLLCLGEECTPMIALFSERHKPAELFSDRLALKRRLFSLARPGDVVLLKGGNLYKLWEVLE